MSRVHDTGMVNISTSWPRAASCRCLCRKEEGRQGWGSPGASWPATGNQAAAREPSRWLRSGPTGSGRDGLRHRGGSAAERNASFYSAGEAGHPHLGIREGQAVALGEARRRRWEGLAAVMRGVGKARRRRLGGRPAAAVRVVSRRQECAWSVSGGDISHRMSMVDPRGGWG
jgi:hypothetical protein